MSSLSLPHLIRISSLTFCQIFTSKIFSFYQSLHILQPYLSSSLQLNFIIHWHTRTNSSQTTIFPFLFVHIHFFPLSSFANCLVLLIALKSSKTLKILSVSFFFVFVFSSLFLSLWTESPLISTTFKRTRRYNQSKITFSPEHDQHYDGLTAKEKDFEKKNWKPKESNSIESISLWTVLLLFRSIRIDSICKCFRSFFFARNLFVTFLVVDGDCDDIV